MRVAYISDDDFLDANVLSGTPYCIYEQMQAEDMQLRSFFVNEAQQLLPPLQEFVFRCKQLGLRLLSPNVLNTYYHLPRAKQLGKLFTSMLSTHQTDIILSTTNPLPIAFLETKTPIVHWTDWVFGGLVGFYPSFREYHPDSVWDSHEITEAALRNTSLLIFSSQWAARSAIELYGISKDKIKVAPFGANLKIEHTPDELKNFVKKRSTNLIKLLFVGKDWYRKGGDFVLKVTEALDAAGYAVELTIVGHMLKKPFAPYIRCFSFLSKKNPAHIATLKRLYQEAHFLFVPSRAEAFGIVFCEANAFGVPCISTQVGGIPEVIIDDVNGKKFCLEATIEQYCDYIINLIDHPLQYETLALSSFNEYQSRLNWQTACKQVKHLMEELL